ncbi:hypothetical protein QAO71_15755 [Halopseudomonas sp. SMJS2]|uniref:hypothetical protein n=1 Tax=Halopseudomonas sp. SMJS2 TaxID=3041098 RepID=UPI0024535F10|nr:hypothetical protein [Halopseudomonas sp. SMJS2]WGK61480.1 hypothetical protein QAO71_15755 [Halopseudomonas sp. SMJS2]
MLRPIERGIEAYRQLQGLPPLYHVRLKHQGRTLAVLSGKSEIEAYRRAERLADELLSGREGVRIEPA